MEPLLAKRDCLVAQRVRIIPISKKASRPPVTEGRQGQGKGKPGMLLVVGDGLLDELEELVGGVGAVLDQMRKDGSYAKLYEKWFGFAPKESDM